MYCRSQIIVLFVFIFSFCRTSLAQESEIHWILPKEQAPKKVIVALHGLNSSVDTLDDIAEGLTVAGFATVRVTLSGNEPDETKIHTATKDRWVNNLLSGVGAAKKKFPNLPIYNLSYSAGGATSIVASYNDFSINFKGYALIAPAVELRTYTQLLIPVIGLSWENLLLPTLAPERYRAHKWVSINSYRALYDVVDEARSKGFSDHMKSVPGIIIVDPGDEFIPYTSLRNFLKKQEATRWEFLRVDCDGDYSLPFHLTTIKSKLGDSEFSRVLSGIIRTFNK